MADIACVRSTATDRRNRRNSGARLIRAFARVTCLPLVLAATAPPNPDPVFPFAREIEAFAKADVGHPVVADAVLFLGSSSVRLWNTGADFSDMPTVNRGFGGATTPHILHYYDRLRPPARPRAVIVYVGENDLAGGAGPDQVTRDILLLLRRLRADYPKAPIACLSLKPSPLRWTLWPKMAAVNAGLIDAARHVRFAYLDVGRLLIAPDGLPDASLFRSDGLHMNARGYERWNGAIRAWIAEASPRRRTALSD